MDRCALPRQAPHVRSRAGLAAAGLLVLAGCSAGGGSASGGSCAPPGVSLDPVQARVGDEVVVAATWLRVGCDDTGHSAEERPLTDVPVSFVQGETRVPLPAMSATGGDSSGSVSFAVPARATAGPAQVVLDAPDAPVVTLTVLP